MSDPVAHPGNNDDQRDERIGRILNEFLDLRSRGAAVDEEALIAQHSDLADELRENLDVLRDLYPATGRIESLIAQGVLSRSDQPQYLASMGDYKILAVIGRGGMGIVLKAYEQTLDRVVALKILRPDLVNDHAALARFAREAKAAGALRHPNIVTVHQIGQVRGVPYIVMEHVAGRSVADLVRSTGALPPAFCRAVFRQLLQGLQGAHDANLVHRDVKSSNIIVEFDGAPSTTELPRNPIIKIADFGLARMRTSQTQLTLADAVVGTPEYMSPEQARGEWHIDQRADLYSAGVVLYEMLTGQTPFRTDTPTATIHRILHEPPAAPRQSENGIDANLMRLALRLMAKQPDNRFGSAREVLTILDANAAVRLPEHRRRLYRGAAAVTAAAAAVLAGGTFWLKGTGPSPGMSARTITPTAVWVDEVNPHAILAQYGHGGPRRVFHTIPSGEAQFSAVAMAWPAAAETPVIVAGTSRSVEDHCLFAFDSDGKELWRLNLSSEIQWPDCAPPTNWRCPDLLAANLDGEPGDELAVIASDAYEYPTRVSIITPRTGEVDATFWHMGHLSDISLAPDFFGNGHPALLFHGVNNKLDGFYRPSPRDVEPSTRYDMVTVVGVLDPQDMDGLGPPRTWRVPELAPANVYAYAILDRPPGDTATFIDVPGGEPVVPPPDDYASIESFAVGDYPRRDETTPWLIVGLKRPMPPNPGSLVVDRRLNLLELMAANAQAGQHTLADWRRSWKPLIQDGRRTCAGLGRQARNP